MRGCLSVADGCGKIKCAVPKKRSARRISSDGCFGKKRGCRFVADRRAKMKCAFTKKRNARRFSPDGCFGKKSGRRFVADRCSKIESTVPKIKCAVPKKRSAYRFLPDGCNKIKCAFTKNRSARRFSSDKCFVVKGDGFLVAGSRATSGCIDLTRAVGGAFCKSGVVICLERISCFNRCREFAFCRGIGQICGAEILKRRVLCLIFELRTVYTENLLIVESHERSYCGIASEAHLYPRCTCIGRTGLCRYVGQPLPVSRIRIRVARLSGGAGQTQCADLCERRQQDNLSGHCRSDGRSASDAENAFGHCKPGGSGRQSYDSAVGFRLQQRAEATAEARKMCDSAHG